MTRDSGASFSLVAAPAAVVKTYLLGSLAYTGGHYPDAYASTKRSFHWFGQLFSSGLEGWGLGFICDLGHLLQNPSAFVYRSLQEYARWSPEQRRIRLAYENGLLNNLSHCPPFSRLVAAVALAGGTDEVLVHALSLLLAPHRASGVTLGATTLREISWERDLDWYRAAARFESWCQQPGYFLQQLAALCEQWPDGAQLARHLGAADYEEIENFRVFTSPRQRLAARAVQDIIAAIGPYQPPRRTSLMSPSGLRSCWPQEGDFPAGGITAITRHGELSNLLSSELVYIEPDSPVDLFDVRYIHKQLLFYLREQGQYRQQQRRIYLFIMLGPWLRVKYPQHQHRLDILVSALALRLIADLVTLTNPATLRITLGLVYQSEEFEDRSDAALLGLLLKKYRAQGLVEIAMYPLRARNPSGPSLSWERYFLPLVISSQSRAQVITILPRHLPPTCSPPEVEYHEIRWDRQDGFPRLRHIRDQIMGKLLFGADEQRSATRPTRSRS